jgi:polyhydroxybutyrate depolymerase
MGGSTGPTGPTGPDAAAGASGGAGVAGGGASGSGAADGTAGASGAGGVDSGSGGRPCVGDWKAGDYPPGLTQETYLEITGVQRQQGLTRRYKVHVPPSYDCTVPAPVLFCLHGLGQTPVLFCMNGTGFPGGSGFPAKSDAEGFILVMPLGHQNSWNGTGCCGTAASMQLDDVALMRAIFQEIGSHLNVDRRRVFATGLSNGGYMSYRLACEAADLFTAVAPAAGGIANTGGCNPSQPISVLDIHGTADGLVPFSLQRPSLARIAAAGMCSSSTGPATQPRSGGDTTCTTHADCSSGVEVTGCAVQNGGHAWFGDPSCGTGAGATGCGIVGANSSYMVNTNVVWEFFKNKAKAP